jgi:NAD(P)-dependent dehydrogenase (short-subunit alcohol dehydrogenase family)
MKKVIIAGISSDIGTALANEWSGKNWQILGTYRTSSDAVIKLESSGVKLVQCDFSSAVGVDAAAVTLKESISKWDVLVLAPGLQDPVGLFVDSNIDDWIASVTVNFLNQVRFIHKLLDARSTSNLSPPTVILFAGGGTNNAPTHYSAYITSKIALMKFTELMAIELPDTKFVILGPGWVKTKIHESTVRAKERAGSNYERTLEKYSSGDWVSMQSVIECCGWIVDADIELLSGRNFSLVHDKWGSIELNESLKNNSDLYKLRRYGNEILSK